MSYLLVGGDFNREGGRRSGYIDKLAEAMRSIESKVFVFNGGPYTDVAYLVGQEIHHYDTVFWFANVPNEEEDKAVRKIKQHHPTCTLVTSKRNNKEYSFQDMVGHALQLRSNLFVEFSKVGSVFRWRLFDPLGNEYYYRHRDPSSIEELAVQLIYRTRELRKVTRVRSKRIGKAIPVPAEEEFFELLKTSAERFHELVGTDTSRFLGNASFRCTKGFPSFRSKDLIFMSRRNVDKRHIGPESFVAVNSKNVDTVEYWGEHKPSVDTPIQVRLYQYYPNINYILHGHVYLNQMGIRTHRPVPCGSIEEFYEIIRVAPYRNSVGEYINLSNHGFLAMVKSVDLLRDLSYQARPTPEVIG